MPPQQIGKYARLEVELKYLLNQPPAGLLDQEYSWHIVDRYVIDTRFRLRRMTSPSGLHLLKLTQKYQDDGQDETQTTITNMYLNEKEYHLFAKLPAREIIKKRYHFDYQNRQYRIDIFEEALAGLILAEIEAEQVEDVVELPTPPFAVTEVTANLFFTGGHLATVTSQELHTELARRLGLTQ